MRILNIDALDKGEGRELVLNGKAYKVVGMNVDNFITTTKVAESMAGETSLVKQVEATIDMIDRCIPGVDRAALGKLSLPALQAIVAFIRGEEVEGVETRDAGEGDEAKK